MPKDQNKLAYKIVQMSTDEPPAKELKKNEAVISKYLASIGKKGGLIGGKVRAQRLTPERRKEIARKAAMTRWKRK
jgi:hypothetical protein